MLAFPSEDANDNANGEDANGEAKDGRVSNATEDSTTGSSEGHLTFHA